MKHLNKERGAAHLVLILALVVGLVGVLGFLGYNAWQNTRDNKTAHASTQVVWSQKCGSGYELIGKQVRNKATLRIFFNQANRTNCAILVNTTGIRAEMTVKIEGGGVNAGNFSEYAGPVYRQCGGGLASGKITVNGYGELFSLRTRSCA